MVESFVMPKLLEKLNAADVSRQQYELMAYGNLANKKFGGTSIQGSLHAKFWMIDNYSVGIGTSNIDPISRLTNSEIVANVFSLDGDRTTKSVENYYQKLKSQSTHWGEPEFIEAKYRPELKLRLVMQSFVAKVMRTFKLLPQD